VGNAKGAPKKLYAKNYKSDSATGRTFNREKVACEFLGRGGGRGTGKKKGNGSAESNKGRRLELHCEGKARHSRAETLLGKGLDYGLGGGGGVYWARLA